MPLLSGAPQVKPAPRIGERVAVLSGCDNQDRELVGWVLNLPDDKIRIAANQHDDGRPGSTWWRRTFLQSEVTVIVLTPSTPAALAHIERHHS